MLKILDKIYRFLAIRPRSEKELRDYLTRKKIKKPGKILDTLKEQHLIDDSVFAEWWLEQRATFRPKGKIALKSELKRKGISEEIIQKKLESIDELTLVQKAIARKKFESTQKIITFLKYRGFSWSTIKTIIDNQNLKE